MRESISELGIDLQADSELLVEQAERYEAGSDANPDAWLATLNEIHTELKSRQASAEFIQRIELLISLHKKLSMIPQGRRVHAAVKTQRWEQIESKLQQQSIGTVILYGAGKHTQWLLESGWPKSDAIAVKYIIDDNPSTDSVHGVPVITPTELAARGAIGCVMLPSSDAHEERIIERASGLAESLQIEIWAVYSNDELGRAHHTQGQTTSASTITRSDADLLDPAPTHRTQLGLNQSRAWLDDFLKLPALVDWASGFMNDIDTAFSWDVLEAMLKLGSDEIIMAEVGTASGVSTARMAMGLNHLAQVPWQIHSFDIAEMCYFDESRPVGSAIQELAPHLTDRIHLHTSCNANDAGRTLAAGSVQLAIIDADHDHPAPTLDLLALLPTLAPHAWVILHDIELEQMTEGIEEHVGKQNGASRLFHAYPGQKVREEREVQLDSNTGALQMPADPLSLRAILIKLIDQPA